MEKKYIKEVCNEEFLSIIDTFTKNSNYHLFVNGNNGDEYLIKLRQSDCDDRLAQEYLAYELCDKLRIETPKFDLLTLDHKVFENKKEDFERHNLNEAAIKLSHNLYFGSKLIKPIKQNNGDVVLNYDTKPDFLYNDLKKIENLEILAEIIAFTCFIANGDQFSNVFNILIKEDKSHAYAIDFGNSFFYNDWSYSKKNYIRKVCNYSNQNKLEIAKEIEEKLFDDIVERKNFCLDAMQKYIDFKKNNPFAKIVHRIETLSDSFIIEAVNNIPDVWLVNPKEEKEVYISFLISQKSIVRDIINEACRCNLHHFDNWNGQKLYWN
ncbi:hypothetical protein SAMN04487792_1673 [Lactobacillus bombicola]|uniref:Uncharacterized protein n=1 Tax=Lactobacillus bombicola TaxID=1505723 RepID=A0A1I1TX90_9LACO|nr:HipA family kinase [Lactobacillus bombicola]SFD63256.1 hypothetical protein SAMN04487792_1673 [Lactobacillus bombicola]